MYIIKLTFLADLQKGPFENGDFLYNLFPNIRTTYRIVLTWVRTTPKDENIILFQIYSEFSDFLTLYNLHLIALISRYDI